MRCGIWGGGNWKTYKFVYGEPLNITVVIPEEDRVISFNPYKHFKDINKPTKEELTLFEIEFNYDYNRCKKEIIELVN